MIYKQKPVVPGFIDSHIHVADFGKFLNWLNLNDATSIEEMQTRLKDRLQKVPKNRWIVGNGWNETRFAEKRCPNRFDLGFCFLRRILWSCIMSVDGFVLLTVER